MSCKVSSPVAMAGFAEHFWLKRLCSFGAAGNIPPIRRTLPLVDRAEGKQTLAAESKGEAGGPQGKEDERGGGSSSSWPRDMSSTFRGSIMREQHNKTIVRRAAINLSRCLLARHHFLSLSQFPIWVSLHLSVRKPALLHVVCNGMECWPRSAGPMLLEAEVKGMIMMLGEQERMTRGWRICVSTSF